jgi:hypothetical protein
MHGNINQLRLIPQRSTYNIVYDRCNELESDLQINK